MRVGLIGIGRAGGQLVEALLSYEASSSREFVAASVAVDTSKADLVALDRVPTETRVLIGQTRVNGQGTGRDNELGAEIVEADLDQIRTAIHEIPAHRVDAFFVVAGLGGGTGSGGAPVIARELDRLFTEPIYGLGALPGQNEERVHMVNAARSFQTFVRETDNLLLVDNDGWDTNSGFGAVNGDIARRLGILCNAGEITGDTVPESVVDASEIINTLGSGGVATIGYNASRIEKPDTDDGGLFSRGSDPEPDVNTQNQITSTIRLATLGKLSLPCDVSSTERALVVVAGPPAYLDRRGIERGRKWLEDETGTMEVRGGDFPVPDSGYIAAVVMLSGVSNVPRIKQLQRVAVETQRELDEETDDESDLDDLVEESDDTTDPLF